MRARAIPAKQAGRNLLQRVGHELCAQDVGIYRETLTGRELERKVLQAQGPVVLEFYLESFTPLPRA